METPSLLTQIIKHRGNKPACMPVGTISGILSHARVSPAKTGLMKPMSDKDRYDSSLLDELFVELSFYYRQSPSDKSADDRLGRVLKALATTLSQASAITIERFFESNVDNEECLWFMISTFSDYPHISPVFFKEKLTDTFKRSNQLTEEFKAALVRSKAGALKDELQGVFTSSTHASKLAILDILVARQELDEQWLHSVEKSVEPTMKEK